MLKSSKLWSGYFPALSSDYLKYFGNFHFYEAVTLTSKKIDRRTQTDSKVIFGAESTNILDSTILNMVDIFSKKSKKKCNKIY